MIILYTGIANPRASPAAPQIHHVRRDGTARCTLAWV